MILMPHKHAAVIKAWADGAEIQYKPPNGGWTDAKHPGFNVDWGYRVKPAPPMIVRALPYLWKDESGGYRICVVTPEMGEIDRRRKQMESLDGFVRWLPEIETTVEQP